MGKFLKLACIFLASGRSTRFGGNKLLANLDGKPMIDRMFDHFPSELFLCTVVVTRYAPVAVSAAERGYSVAENSDKTGDIARTIQLGLSSLPDGMDGCMFSVCDQPMLSPESIGAVVREFTAHPDAIVALGRQGRRGNPVLFPASLFHELEALEPGQGGSAVIVRHKELLRLVEVCDPKELEDIDYQSDLEKLWKQ